MGRVYRKPPIIEALCEVQFSPDSPWDPTFIGLIYDKVRGTFSERGVAHMLAIEPPLPGGDSPRIRSDARSHFTSPDRTSLMQIAPHLLVVNRLAPYLSWQHFSPQITQALMAYREVAGPRALHRIGVRYINRIALPEGAHLLQDYFRVYPQLDFPAPTGSVPLTYGGFVVGVQFPYAEGRDVLRLQLTAVSSTPERPEVLFDLDYALMQSEAIPLDAVAEWIGGAHDRIEAMFEACITDRTRAVFEEVSS